MMGFMSNCNRFTSWPLTMQNSGLYTAWNGCCPMDSGFSRTSIKSLFSSSFERRFSPIYIRKNFWYIVLLVCGLIYIGQGSFRRWNTWSMPYLELEYMSLWSTRHPGDPTLLLTPVIHCPRKDLRSWSQNTAYDIFHTHRSVQKAFSPAPVWLQRLSAFSSLSSTLQN